MALWALIAALIAAVPPPAVAGPRDTTSARPVYRFSAAGAVGFRCAFDSVALHGCAARYSELLSTGRHVLRVRAVARDGSLSRLVAVTVTVRSPPTLTASAPIPVGDGAGVPAVGAGAVWVPTTGDGRVARLDPATRTVTAVIPALAPAPVETGCALNVACGYLNAALVSGGDVWVSGDFAGEVVRIDASTSRVGARFAVSARPGGLAAGGGFVWVFHTLGSTVTRIDPTAGKASAFTVPGAKGAGIAYTRGVVWLLSVDPAAVLRLDPATLAVTARVLLEPFGVRHPFRQAWSVAAGQGSLWAANPNYDMVTEVDTAAVTVRRHVRLPRDQPFGVVVSDNEVWVAARTGVVRLRTGTGTVVGELILPSVGSGYASIAYGFGAAWATNYDRGAVTRVAVARR